METRSGRSSSAASNISALTDDEHRYTSGSLAEAEDEDVSNDGDSVERQSKRQEQSAIRKRAISEAAARDAIAALEAESPVAANGNGREPAVEAWEKEVDGVANGGDGGRSGGSGSPMDDGDNENDTNVSAEERERRKAERLKRHRERKQVRPNEGAAVPTSPTVLHPRPPTTSTHTTCTNAHMYGTPLSSVEAQVGR